MHLIQMMLDPVAGMAIQDQADAVMIRELNPEAMLDPVAGMAIQDQADAVMIRELNPEATPSLNFVAVNQDLKKDLVSQNLNLRLELNFKFR
jgi:YHS domain-containing protein